VEESALIDQVSRQPAYLQTGSIEAPLLILAVAP
jgi:hypothetical protein